eukprot:SAG31_NODE_462_length_15340_cov_2.972968_2_plen_357_part_00
MIECSERTTATACSDDPPPHEGVSCKWTGGNCEAKDEIKFGLVTMAKMDHIANLANALCGLAGIEVQTDSFLPTVELSNVEATLMLASDDINVAGYDVKKGVSFKLTTELSNLPDVVQEAKTGLGFPPGECEVCAGTDCTVHTATSRQECEDTDQNPSLTRCAFCLHRPPSLQRMSDCRPCGVRRTYTQKSQSVLTATAPFGDTSDDDDPLPVKVTFGFEKVPPAVRKTYLGCFNLDDEAWQKEYSLGVTNAPTGECADKCGGVFTHMGLSWRDQCYCMNGFSDLTESATTCGDAGSSCADGDMRTCSQVRKTLPTILDIFLDKTVCGPGRLLRSRNWTLRQRWASIWISSVCTFR